MLDTGANRAPRITSAVATPAAGYGAPLTVAFSATATDADGDALSYSWSFGDGGTSSVANPTHSYQQIGVYDARLTVSRVTKAPPPAGLSSSRPVRVRVLSAAAELGLPG